jgi:hypothetical protein
MQPPHAARRVWPPCPSSLILCSSRSAPATWHCAMVRALAPRLLLQRLDADFRKHGFRNVRFAAGTCRHDFNSQGQCVDCECACEGVSAPVIPSDRLPAPLNRARRERTSPSARRASLFSDEAVAPRHARGSRLQRFRARGRIVSAELRESAAAASSEQVWGAAGGRLFAVAGHAVFLSGGVSNASREVDGRD